MRRNGFTLLEILVALVVLGFLLAGLSQGVRFGLQAWATQTRRVGQQADMDAVDRTLRRLIAQCDPGEQGQPPSLQGTAHTLDFHAQLPPSQPGVLALEAELALGVDAAHRLVLRTRPAPHAEALQPQVAEVVVLLEGVQRLDIGYFRDDPKTPGWVDAWSEPSPPSLIRLRIGFPAKDPRHWPDLLAAPMRAQAPD